MDGVSVRCCDSICDTVVKRRRGRLEQLTLCEYLTTYLCFEVKAVIPR